MSDTVKNQESEALDTDNGALAENHLEEKNKISDDLLKDMEKKIEAAEQEAKDSYDRLLRISAEFENYKKRSAREADTFKKFANESLIKALLPIVDNLERAVESSGNGEDNSTCIVEGVNMTLKEILKVFEKFNVTSVESLEKEFDPGFHEAVMQEESEEHPDNIVLKELQKGYLMHDRLIRPAMVVVSKAKENNGN